MKKMIIAVLFSLFAVMPMVSAEDIWVYTSEDNKYEYYVDDTSPCRIADADWSIRYSVVDKKQNKVLRKDTMCFYIEGNKVCCYDLSNPDRVRHANIFNETGPIFLWLTEWKKTHM